MAPEHPPRTRIPLCNSGLTVAPLGWGMWRFASGAPDTARARVEAALEIGCTLFDTADIYGYSRGTGFGAAETLLGDVLHEAPALRARMVLATKAGIEPRVPYNSSAHYLIDACEGSLRRLRVEHVELLQIHRPDLLVHPAEVADAFERLLRAGKIRAIGVSNHSAAQVAALMRYLPAPLASVQNEFSALALEPLTDGTMDLAMQHGTAVLAWSPLAQGLLAGRAPSAAEAQRVQAVTAALDAVAARCGGSRAAVAYAWVMAHPARPIPLIGTQNVERIREAALAYRIELTRAEWYRVLEASRGAPLP
ncbi:MAG TPA: aldo/keto reductase [Candidatus Dormibacteraeota bacterium]|nr:aldo/keto reductase [Candidatus Dormibacteraeota bacterium]